MNSHRFSERCPTQAAFYAELPNSSRHTLDRLAANPWTLDSVATLARLIAKHGPAVVALLVTMLNYYQITVPTWVKELLTSVLETPFKPDQDNSQP